MARAVGNALHKNPDPLGIPCFRVVNSKGECSGSFAFGGSDAQAERLRADGIEVVDGRVDLERYGMKIDDSKRIGVAKGKFVVPDDFDEIAEMFEGGKK
jgi:hypothetical protein